MRMEEGVRWHKRLQQEEQAAADCMDAAEAPRFEVPLAGTILLNGWCIELQGRIDQILSTKGRKTLREVKTVAHPLPMPEEELRRIYPEYLAQLGAYQVLGSLEANSPLETAASQLLFVDVESGMRQIVSGGEGARTAFDSQLQQLLKFCESRRAGRQRLMQADIASPFDNPRPGQERIDEELHKASIASKYVLFEAPTGYGKTAIALYHVLTGLKSGMVNRAIFLSSRSTGQMQVLEELERRWADCVLVQNMRSHAEHSIVSPMHTCDDEGSCRLGIEEKWRASGLDAARLSEQGPMTLDHARSLGEQTGVCPFEITRSVLPFADVWVGDCNYVFHPRARGVFLEQPGFDASQTFLIVDEAHNLPSRVADAWSAQFDSDRLETLSIELGFAGAFSRLRRALESIRRYVGRLERSDRHPDTVRYQMLDLVRDFSTALEETPPDYERMRAGVMGALWELADAVQVMENDNLDLLYWSPAPASLSVTCVDASRQIGQVIGDFGGALLMSATIRPVENTAAALGMDGRVGFVRAYAPWRAEAYDVAVDMRADTSLRAREKALPLTAESILDVVRMAAKHPVATFFPSYKYARDVADAMFAEGTYVRIAMQPKGLDLAGQKAFIEDSLAGGFDVIMLVLGGGFTEGIDALGGRVSHAVVVSPALPEAGPVQKQRLENHHGTQARAFHDVYIVPGIRKVGQALGRLVRAPGQTAKVLLHCRRFADEEYSGLLDEDMRPQTRIQTREELLAWLEKGL
jgi:Rad3-related DNA helicase